MSVAQTALVRLCQFNIAVFAANVDQFIARIADRANEITAIVIDFWRQARKEPCRFASYARPHRSLQGKY